jgi:hypothetical protein
MTFLCRTAFVSLQLVVAYYVCGESASLEAVGARGLCSVPDFESQVV